MTLERWITFSKHEQLLFITSELERARVWEKSDNEKFRSALTRGLELIDLALQDDQWKDGFPMLQGLRDETAKLQSGTGTMSTVMLLRAL